MAEKAGRQCVDLSGTGWGLLLDPDAGWRNDPLLLPPVHVAALPARPPTGGWERLRKRAIKVDVPGTIEQHLWDKLGGYVGVSWWRREFNVPAAAAGKRIILQFESVRLRAEVFLNEQLIGYDAVGNTPFEVDVTDAVRLGEPNRMAIRVTNPGGNFTWEDDRVHHWGGQPIPASHGFGGVTGPVRVLIVDPVYIEDVFIRNKPAVTDIDLEITVRNTTPAPVQRDVSVRIRQAANPERVVFEQTWPDVGFPVGEYTIRKSISIPDARVWNLDHPHLHTCRVSLGGADQKDVRFGFRWFAPEGVGSNAMFRLNGRRIVLRSAISWGFWPTGGLIPTAELAEKQTRAAKALGLNTLNFHRCIGTPLLLDLADELGLLIYEEPGGYACHEGDELAFARAREKLLRMVKRDRNHPSLIIYNMINEETAPPEDRHKRDMADAHRLDPTRTITFTSGWAKAGDDPIKLHMRPCDDRQHTRGWYDHHNAAGPGVYRDEFYRGPAGFSRHTANKEEIVFWGEEGAIAAPPQLERIVRALQDQPNGWDGADYRAWHQAYEEYLDKKGFKPFFPSVDALTQSLGNVAYNYQGRMIENIRISNHADGYAVNGWECEKTENHSGIVDCFRNFKGNPQILAHYNAPLYIAVKLRSKVAHLPAVIVADFYIVNETNLRGQYELVITVEDQTGNRIRSNHFGVQITGGETYGELLVADVPIEITQGPGRYVAHAALVETDAEDRELARGRDDVFVVDWKNEDLPIRGAILESTGAIRDFLRDEKGVALPHFSDDLPPLDYIVVGDADPIAREPVPADCLIPSAGNGSGLSGEYHKGFDLENLVFKRHAESLDCDFGPDGPDPRLDPTHHSIRWTGRIKPPETGPYRFHTQTDHGARLWIDGKPLIDQWYDHGSRHNRSELIPLEAGREYDIRLEFHPYRPNATLRLLWSTPPIHQAAQNALSVILQRVAQDGTTAIFLDRADVWAALLAEQTALTYHGCLPHGRYWLGGGFFVRKHPLFDGLPVNCAMDWEYQELIQYGAKRFGLLLDGEETIVGCVTGHEHKVAAAVALVPHKKGRLLLSTLDILGALHKPPGPADTIRKLLCNYIRLAARSRSAGK